MEDFTIAVQNFGPIHEGSLKIKPMTILLGKNNTGKSYMAMLIHTFLETLTKTGIGEGEYFLDRSILYNQIVYREMVAYRRRRFRMDHAEVSAETRKQFSDFLHSGLSKDKLSTLPEQLVSQLTFDTINAFKQQFKGVFIGEMERIFGCRMHELCSQGKDLLTINISFRKTTLSINCSKKNETNIELNMDKPVVSFSVLKARDIHTAWKHQNGKITVFIPETLIEEKKKEKNEKKSMSEVEEYPLVLLIDALRDYMLGPRDLSMYSFYLPAARSGILSAHKVLASGLLRQLPYVGIRKMEFLPLSGTITDFLANIIQLPRHPSEYSDLANLLEERVTEGKVDIKEMEKMTYPEIYYESKGLKLPIHRSSSMVSEMAPLILYLKYLIEPRSTLVIEEPESHLHPEAQTRLAKILIRLINRQVRVIETSHSDFLLHQVQNLVLASGLSENKLASLKIDKRELMPSDHISVYLFKRSETEGTIFHQVDICDPTMKDSGFNEISDELYGESVKLDRALEEKQNE